MVSRLAYEVTRLLPQLHHIDQLLTELGTSVNLLAEVGEFSAVLESIKQKLPGRTTETSAPSMQIQVS